MVASPGPTRVVAKAWTFMALSDTTPARFLPTIDTTALAALSYDLHQGSALEGCNEYSTSSLSNAFLGVELWWVALVLKLA